MFKFFKKLNKDCEEIVEKNLPKDLQYILELIETETDKLSYQRLYMELDDRIILNGIEYMILELSNNGYTLKRNFKDEIGVFINHKPSDMDYVLNKHMKKKNLLDEKNNKTLQEKVVESFEMKKKEAEK